MFAGRMNQYVRRAEFIERYEEIVQKRTWTLFPGAGKTSVAAFYGVL